jgi:NADH-quinone oxidoreductase subunit D
MTTTDDFYAGTSETTDAPADRVFTVSGQDWDDIAAGLGDEGGDAQERVVVNMGPQHPSTHGVLRLVLHLSGETFPRLQMKPRAFPTARWP